MRSTFALAGLAILLAPPGTSGERPVTAADLKVGYGLQAIANVRLGKAAPEQGVQLTLTSDNPGRMLLSTAADKKGSQSITLKVLPKYFEGPDFWVQALAGDGAVTYTVTASGIGRATGTVTLAPSAVAILGPLKLPSFSTTPRGAPSRITVLPVALDSSGKILEDQQVAGGSSLHVNITNSDPKAGSLDAGKLTIPGGESQASTIFRPSIPGITVLAPEQPAGFSVPAERGSLRATVELPGLAIADQLMLGKDLQTPGLLCLGEAAPPGGLKVTLISSDPKKLILSTRPDEPGSGSVIITVPEGTLTAKYYLQALGESGAVAYTASASGFRSRVGRITLTPSGVIVAYYRYGPPDEAAVLRNSSETDDRRFYVSLEQSKGEKIAVVVWTVHLDPQSGLAADLSVEELRAGVTANVSLSSSNPDVATVESPLTIPSGANHAVSLFTPRSKGETIISVSQPVGFSRPKNATRVPANVTE